MSGQGTYEVGPNAAYASIQAAIDALVSDQGPEPFVATQRIVVNRGTYEPFRIEPDTLTPTSAYRLVIEGAVGTLPVVSGRLNPPKSQVGALVGNNVPYVTVQRLRFQDLIKGVVFGTNSHRPVVNKVFVVGCRNVGVWFYQCDEATIANSVVANCAHGLATTQVKSVVVIHNTFFNDTGFSSKKTYPVFLDLQDDRGQGEEDTGRAYLYNNIVYSRGEFGILLYEKDIPHLTSDYNDWWCPGSPPAGGLAEIREPVLDVVHKDYVAELHTDDLFAARTDWRLRTGQDAHSIADDPGFLVPAVNGQSASIDLGLLDSSPVLGKGNLLTSELPAWFEDYTLSAFDFDGNPRKQACAIGAHETCVGEDWFGSTPFSSGSTPFTEGETAEEVPLDECEEAMSFDRAAAAYATAVPAWFPKVHRGTFFVGDASYHLFAEKRGCTLQELSRTSFPTARRLNEEGLRVYLAGREVTEDATWYVDGYTFALYHKGIDFDYDEASDVVVEGTYRRWDSDLGSFVDEDIRHVWKLNEGHTEFVFPVVPVAGQPIVVTDDLIEPGNETGLLQEFHTVFDPVRAEARLEFGGPKNLCPNSDFSYVDTETGFLSEIDTQTGYRPRDHWVYAPSAYLATHERFVSTEGVDVAPVRGRKFFVLGTGEVENYVEQRVRIHPDSAYAVTAHGASIAGGALRVSLQFLDYQRTVLESHGPFEVDLPASAGPALGWTRFGLAVFHEAPSERGLPDFSTFATELSTGIAIPEGAEELTLRFHPAADAVTFLDAIQVEEGYRPGIYTRIPKGADMTVEFETSEGRFYTVSDLSLQPVRNAYARGFFGVVPAPARQWDEDAPALATTLTDADWPWGRLNLLPWAKTSGFGNKYYNSPDFSTSERVAIEEPVCLSPRPAFPGDIRLEPSVLLARQGSEGELFSVEVTDENRNPYAFEQLRATVIEPTGEFPGYLATQEWGLFTRLGQQVTMELDEAGTAVLRWIPPEPEDVEFRGHKPATQSIDVGGETREAGYVDTWYRVYPFNHGSPTLRDPDGVAIGLEGDLVTGAFGGTPVEGHTVFVLKDYPTPGSVEVFGSLTGEIPGTRLLESFSTPLQNRHYYVDYERRQVLVAGTWEYGFRAEYRPRLAWVEPLQPRRIWLSKQALDLVTGEFVAIQYDAVVDLLLEALPPVGMPEAVKATFLQVGIVAQHRDREVTL